MTIKYPTNINPTIAKMNRKSNKYAKRKQSKVNSALKSKKSRKKSRSHKSTSKYMNHRNVYDHHVFDSKTERDYYIYLKACGIKCKCHPRYTVIPHTEYKSKIDGKTYKIRKRNYTPDFVLYDKHGNITEVDDVKGILHFPSYDRLRMNLFSLKYHMPITIVRRGRHHTFTKTNI